MGTILTFSAKTGAAKAGLKSVPCWVRELDDDEAYMQLALGNSQGELSPLEIGVHALKVVEVGQIGQGRGNKGGIREYARLLGKQHSYIIQVKQAAYVLNSIENGKSTYHFLEKSQHLTAIHKAPKSTWPLLAEWIIAPNIQDKTPSAKQAQEIVKQICKFEIPEAYQDVYPITLLVQSYLA